MGMPLSQVAESDRDGRSEPRVRMEEPATLNVLRPAGGDQMGVTILNMSQSGLRVRTAEELPEGALVHIRIRDTLVAMGEVRHSKRVEG